MQKQKAPFDNVNIEWNLTYDEVSTENSDDETGIDDRVSLATFRLEIARIIVIKFNLIRRTDALRRKRNYYLRVHPVIQNLLVIEA